MLNNRRQDEEPLGVAERYPALAREIGEDSLRRELHERRDFAYRLFARGHTDTKPLPIEEWIAETPQLY